ncbi:MAG TPA: SRPBCC family protein [Nonomuraea sp.]|nr:SRPBCC family protein [Nonomuraea sp.]
MEFLPIEAAGDAVTGATTGVEVRTVATPVEVYDLVTDVARIGEWSPECTAAAWMNASGPAAGARFEARNHYPDGQISRVTCVVTRAARPHTFAWDVLDGTGRPGSRWSYEITRDARSTVVRHRFTHGPGGTGLRDAAEQNPDGGPGAVTMTAVARSAGAPSGSVYHRFPGRPALLAALWLRTVDRFQQGFLAALDTDPPSQAAPAAARHVIEWSRAHPAGGPHPAVRAGRLRPPELARAGPHPAGRRERPSLRRPARPGRPPGQELPARPGAPDLGGHRHPLRHGPPPPVGPHPAARLRRGPGDQLRHRSGRLKI